MRQLQAWSAEDVDAIERKRMSSEHHYSEARTIAPIPLQQKRKYQPSSLSTTEERDVNAAGHRAALQSHSSSATPSETMKQLGNSHDHWNNTTNPLSSYRGGDDVTATQSSGLHKHAESASGKSYSPQGVSGTKKPQSSGFVAESDTFSAASGTAERLDEERVPEVPVDGQVPLPTPRELNVHTLFEDVVYRISTCFRKSTRKAFVQWCIDDLTLEMCIDLMWCFIIRDFLPQKHGSDKAQHGCFTRFRDKWLHKTQPASGGWPDDSFAIALQYVLAACVFRCMSAGWYRSAAFLDFKYRQKVLHQVLVWISGLRHSNAPDSIDMLIPGDTQLSASKRMLVSPLMYQKFYANDKRSNHEPHLPHKLHVPARALTQPVKHAFNEELYQDSYASFLEKARSASQKQDSLYNNTASAGARAVYQQLQKHAKEVHALDAELQEISGSGTAHAYADALTDEFVQRLAAEAEKQMQEYTTATGANQREASQQQQRLLRNNSKTAERRETAPAYASAVQLRRDKHRRKDARDVLSRLKADDVPALSDSYGQDTSDSSSSVVCS